VREDVKDFSKSRDGVTNVNGVVVAKDISSIDTECQEYREEILYKLLQLHTALSVNEFEMGTTDNGAIVYPHSSHVSNNKASNGQGPACAMNQEFEKEYSNSGREVLQRYENTYDLHNCRMKLEQQEYQDEVDSHYYKVPDQESASSSHRCRTIVQPVANSITKLSELRVSSNNFSDCLLTSTTTHTGVSSNSINACLKDSRRLQHNNFMQNVRASTPLAVDRKSVGTDAEKDTEDNDGIIHEQRLNNQCSMDKTWLNRPVNVEKHYNNYIPPCKSCEKVSNVQRK